MSGPKFQRGDIIHTRSPHSDGGDSPHFALVVGDPLDNSQLEYVAIQITSTPIRGKSDFSLADSDPEFSQTGLDHTSTFRCHKLFPLAESRVRTKIGSAGPNTMKAIEQRLRTVLRL